MKKTCLLSLLLALSLLLSSCALLLPEGWADRYTGTRTTRGDYQPNERPSSEEGGGPTPPFEYGEDSTSYGFYYDQLSEDAGRIYRAIYHNSKATAGVPISLSEPLSFTAPEGEGERLTAELQSAVLSLIQPAMDALVYDHPELAWIAAGGDRGSTFTISTNRLTENGTETATVSYLTFHLALKEPLASIEDATALETAISEAIAAFPTSGASRYEILSSIQGELCRRVTYDSTATRPHEAAGALLDGRAVCDGYAKAFKLLCDAQGIPCIIVAGTANQSGASEPHAWNYVQMENGRWYGVDVTWNDEGAFAASDYFLVGALTVNEIARGSFSHSHVPDGKFSGGCYEPFLFPPLENHRYDPYG